MGCRGRPELRAGCTKRCLERAMRRGDRSPPIPGELSCFSEPRGKVVAIAADPSRVPRVPGHPLGLGDRRAADPGAISAAGTWTRWPWVTVVPGGDSMLHPPPHPICTFYWKRFSMVHLETQLQRGVLMCVTTGDPWVFGPRAGRGERAIARGWWLLCG